MKCIYYTVNGDEEEVVEVTRSYGHYDMMVMIMNRRDEHQLIMFIPLTDTF